MRHLFLTSLIVGIVSVLPGSFGAAGDGSVAMVFKIAEGCKIHLANDKPGALANLNTGDRVALAYRQDGDTLIVKRIRVLGENSKPGARIKFDADLHVYGVITALDEGAKTMQIDVHTSQTKPSANK